MTLFDLVNGTTVQGAFIELKVFDDKREEKKTVSFEDVDDLMCEDIREYENMEVLFIYSYAYNRYLANGTAVPLSVMVIEVEED